MPKSVRCLETKPRKKRISRKNMASSSTSAINHIIDVDKIVDLDDFNLSALHDDGDKIFPMSDEKYAQELQLEEALISSASQIVAADISLSLNPATSTPPNKLKRKQPMVKAEEAKLHERLCGICMDTKALPEIFSNAKVCGHLFCSDCISQHVSVKIKENIAKVKCPDPTCEGLIGPEICRDIVPKEVLERWEDALCESLILGTQKFYCPFKDCSAMLVDDGGEPVTSSECPNCHRLFCAQCKVAWHSGVDCSEYKSLKEFERNPEDLMLMELAKNKKWKRCPNCNFYVEKQIGCHRISCRCGNHFCYGCGKKHVGSYACDI